MRQIALAIIGGVMFAVIVSLSLQTRYPTTAIAEANAPNDTTRIVEAEDCLSGIQAGCATEGGWKPWLMSEFSNGALITNEHPLTNGLTLPATLTLSFTGTGVSIVYRQDSWYGTLGVQLDDQPEYHIRQQGAVINQAEACLETTGNNPHTLILSGGEATGAITGIITIDAIKIFTQEQPCGSEDYPCDQRIVIPAYFDPGTQEGDAYWRQLAKAAGTLKCRLIVIANVYNGPDTAPKITYSNAISNVVNNGGKVIGYVHTCYGNQTMPDPDHPLCPKTQASIEQDVDAWFSFYPLISGIFYDEVSTDQSKVAYYQNLYDYVQMKQAGAIVVNNFGVEPHPDYLTIGQSILCTFEGPFARFVGWQPPAWLPKDRSCALVYEVDDLTIAFKYLIKKPVGWFYFISDTLPNPWDILPSYFSDMVSMVCISLASAIIDGPVTGKPDTSYTFTAEISPSIATPPITYTWFPEPDSGQGTTSTTYIWSTVESKVITITATNIGGTVTDTHTICILCQPIYLPLISK